jgi:hypothetical protein|tara:strand:- start:1604 stop:2008 length:405 start_codon:yes stop_codon:yes gene_type:complete
MIEKAIYNILSNVAALATTQIKFGTLPDMKSGGDFIVFYRINTTPYDTKTGRSTLDSAGMQCNIYSNNAETVATLAERVRGALDRTSGTFGGVVVQSIQFENQASLFDFNDSYNTKGVYQMNQSYSCRTEPTYL